MTLAVIINALLTKAAGKAVDLAALLAAVAKAAPDLKPEIDPLLALLAQGADVAGAVTALGPEGLALVQFKFDGRQHPSDGF